MKIDFTRLLIRLQFIFIQYYYARLPFPSNVVLLHYVICEIKFT